MPSENALVAPTAVKTAAYTAVDGDFVPVDTTSAAVTVTLPSPAQDRAVVGVKLVKGGNSVTVAAGGSATFNDSAATTLAISTLNQGIIFQYAELPGVWYALSGDVAGGGGGGFTNPMTTLGDLIYEDATPAAARLAGDTSNTRKFLRTQSTSGTAQAPAWDTIQAGDVPTLNQNTTGTASNVTGTVAIANGGTGQTAQQAALDAIAGGVTSGQYLRGNGTHVALAAIAAADLPAATTSTQGAVILDGTAADIQPAGVAAAGAKGQAADAKHVHPLQPWQFQPEAYGAKGDGKVSGTGSSTNGSATFTDSNASFVSGDVGKTIMINGAAGASATPLITTISAVGSSTSITLGSNASVTLTGTAQYFYGTDDTSAINSAVSAASTYAQANQWYAEVIFSNSLYCVAGAPTQTTATGSNAKQNSQIPVPYPNVNGATRKLVIALLGVSKDAGQAQYFESTVPNLAGSCLVSCVAATGQPNGTYGSQSVVGGPTASTNLTGSFANTKVIVDGLTVVCGWNTQQIGFDFRYLGSASVGRAAYQAFTSVLGSSPKLSSIPGNGQSIGLYMPIQTNNDDCNVGSFITESASVGIAFAEHFTAQRAAAIYCSIGLFVTGNGAAQHGASILYASAEACTTALQSGVPSGGQFPLVIGLLDNEAIVTSDITDSNSTLAGLVHWAAYDHATPRVTGANVVKIISDRIGPGYWSAAPSVPASGTNQQNTGWRDAVVVITGGTVSAITVDGQATGYTATGATVVVPSGKNINITYTVAPSWVWYLL